MDAFVDAFVDDLACANCAINASSSLALAIFF